VRTQVGRTRLLDLPPLRQPVERHACRDWLAPTLMSDAQIANRPFERKRMTDLTKLIHKELDRAGIRREDYVGDTPLDVLDRIQILVEERHEAREELKALTTREPQK
jgi:hypothetical protein